MIALQKRHFLKYNWPGIAWALMIMVLIGIPGNYIPKVETFLDWIGPDKLVHFALFGGQSFFIMFGLTKQYQSVNYRWSFAVAAFTVAVVYGGITELLQAYVFYGRHGSIFDFIANTLGALLGCICYAFYFLKLQKICKQKL